MADEADKEAEAAEKAYAAAAETAPAKVEPVKATQSTPSAAPAVSAEAKPAVKAVSAPKAKPAPKAAAPKAKAPGKKAGPVTARVPVKPKPAAMPTAAKPAKTATEKVLPKKAPVPTKPVIEAKEIFIMAKTTDFTKSMTDAVSATRAQVATISPMPGTAVTIMIGRTDTGPVTTLDDARTVARDVAAQGVRDLRFWSLGRDRGGCPGASEARPDCSGVAQQDFAFIETLRDAVRDAPTTGRNGS